MEYNIESLRRDGDNYVTYWFSDIYEAQAYRATIEGKPGAIQEYVSAKYDDLGSDGRKVCKELGVQGLYRVSYIKMFDVVAHMSQDEFVDAFQDDWPARYPDEDAIKEVPSFDSKREFAYSFVNQYTNDRVLVIVS